MAYTWNPWHGCHKISEGCRNCYVYDRDASYGRDSSTVEQTRAFYDPIKQDRSGKYKIEAGTVMRTCMTSDFFVEDADEWRQDAWSIMRQRPDLRFEIFTKRVDRIRSHLPDDWFFGFDNVVFICSVENQEMADKRLPVFLDIPMKHRMIACAPLLGPINLQPYLSDKIELVSLCGENGKHARPCDYEWVLDIRSQCVQKEIPFHYSKTGTFLVKGGKKYYIPFEKQKEQAHRANIDYIWQSIEQPEG